MSYTPFNESPQPIWRNADKNGMNIREISNFLQGVELRDPLNLRKSLIPKMGMKAPKTDESGFVDNTIEFSDIGQGIKISTTAFVDTTERWTPEQIIQDDISETFLNEIATDQFHNEKNDGDISIFEPNGIEVPYTSRGAKSSLYSANDYNGTQLIESNYRSIDEDDEFLDGQETILSLSVPAIQSLNYTKIIAYDDNIADDTNRFDINILNQNVDLYDRYASQGFVYSNNVRDSIAFGGLKD